MDDAMVCKSLALGYAQFLCIGVSSDILLSLSPGTPWFLYRIPQYNNTSCNFRCCWKSKEVLWRYWNYSNRAFNGRGNGFILWTWFNGNYNFSCLGMTGHYSTRFYGLNLPSIFSHEYCLCFAWGRDFEFLVEVSYLEYF